MRRLLPIILAILVLAGCGRTNDEARLNQYSTENQQAQQVDPNTNRPLAADTATRLEDLARRIPQVQDANCVIIGRTAIVGITVDPNLNRSRVNIIKYSVAEAFRKDPEGIHALVTADMGLGDSIRRIQEDIQEGRPFSGFAEELGDIIGRIAPQLPRDITPVQDGRSGDPEPDQFQSDDL